MSLCYRNAGHYEDLPVDAELNHDCGKLKV